MNDRKYSMNLPDRAAVDLYYRMLRIRFVQLRIESLYHLDEMTYAEIADVMDLPEGTVKSYLFRARKALKDSIESSYGDEELWR